MTDKLVEPDAVDEKWWYRIQSHHVWYAVHACCRSCATRKLIAWTEGGDVKTLVAPDWLRRL